MATHEFLTEARRRAQSFLGKKRRQELSDFLSDLQKNELYIYRSFEHAGTRFTECEPGRLVGHSISLKELTLLYFETAGWTQDSANAATSFLIHANSLPPESQMFYAIVDKKASQAGEGSSGMKGVYFRLGSSELAFFKEEK
ncbi:MAG: hypothetical protein H6502_00090 [Candidatus Woesearchaeota archaeon]|nr:MAG: hypothetical protein H6502_00090 [Candidatus Woesearchaeota archaeon]